MDFETGQWTRSKREPRSANVRTNSIGKNQKTKEKLDQAILGNPIKSMDNITEIAELILKKEKEINHLFDGHKSEVSIPLYCSGDLRDAGFKLGVIDTNLFPAGFNNICKADKNCASKKFKSFITNIFKKPPSKITIISESHTSNLHYLENVLALQGIIKNAGFETTISVPLEIPNGKKSLKTSSGNIVDIYQCKKVDDKLIISNGMIPDLIILNNDLTQGVPEDLKGITQPIFPPPDIGWHSRKKHIHFQFYNKLATELAELLDIDPWFLTIKSKEVADVNFATNTGIEEVSKAVDDILSFTQKKYRENGITIPPFAVIKHNSGTYGIGVITVHSGDELKNLNRKIRDKMSRGKGGTLISEVLVQEGIPTTKIFEDFVGETVLCAVGDEVVGGFMRTHSEKNERENLNVPGSEFKTLCLSDTSSTCDCLKDTKLCGIYKTIMRIAIQATGYELKELLSRNK